MMERIKEWLMDHPKVLWILFLVAAKGAEHIPEITTQNGSTTYKGP